MTKTNTRQTRHTRIRAKVKGTKERPRLAVFRSHRFIYAQLIDDRSGRTLLMASDVAIKEKATKKESKKDDKTEGKKEGEFFKVQKAEAVGKLIAKAALDQGIKAVVFDRGGYQYTGRVKALAEGARAGGLQF